MTQKRDKKAGDNKTGERLITLTVAGLLAINYPLLQLFDVAHAWQGIPVIYLYLFGVWILFIILTSMATEQHDRPPDKGE